MKNFNVVFLGGSITEGAGASSYSNSFAYKIGEYITKKLNNKKVNVFNAGIGGTGSQFGLFRFKKDVIEKDPDLVFVEFAVNDRIIESNSVLITMEGIVRQLLKLSNVPYIIFLITPTGSADACGNLHKKVGYYYNIPCIDIQDYIWNNMVLGKYSWNEIAIDNLHPNDKGHNEYAECIMKFLEENPGALFNMPIHKSNTITGYDFNNPELISYEKATFYGHWSEENINIPKKMEIAAVTDTAGDCLEFNFKGKNIAITTITSRVGGILEVDVDGATASIDLFSDTEPNFNCAINVNNLQEGSHRLILRCSDKKNPLSNGNKIVVGSFMVDEN